MKRIIEFVKKILIIVLTVSMISMTARLMLSDIFSTGTGSVVKNESSFFTGLGLPYIAGFFEKGSTGTLSEFSQSTLLYPYSITVKENETQISAIYDEKLIISAYDKISGAVSEIVTGTVKESEKAFETYTENDGILIDFGRKIPFDIICRISSGKASNGAGYLTEKMYIGRTNCVFTDGKKTYLVDSADTKITGIDGVPSVDVSVYNELLTDVNLKGGSPVTAQEITMPLVEKSNRLYNASAGNYSFANLSAVLTKFGINSGSLNNEIKEDGSVIYVENLRSIMAQTDGNITFAAYQDNGGISLANYIGEAGEKGYTVRDVIIASQKFLASFEKELLGGEASLRLKNAYYDREEKGYVTEFEYCMNGISLNDSYTAAKFVYRNGYFVSADIKLENFSYSQQVEKLEKPESYVRLNAHRNGTVNKTRLVYKGDTVLTPAYVFYWEV